MAYSMGLGKIGSSSLIFKKKNRFTLEIVRFCGGNSEVSVPESFVKIANRPNITIEETQIDFLNGRFWIPGKQTFETINITYHDIAGVGGGSTIPLLSWLASVVDFTDPINLRMASKKNDYAGDARLVMYDGCGTPLEQWWLRGCWPTNINFGDLDMASSDPAQIELTLRYSGLEYKSFCPTGTITSCCTPCTGAA